MATFFKKCVVLLTFILLSKTHGEDVSFASGKNTLKITSQTHNITENTRFIMHDVNPGEGFNLRRDVYLRVANLVKMLNDQDDQHWILVLAPWRHLYHWQNRYLKQEGEPWSNFFDVASLNKYVPVMEFDDFVRVTGSPAIDQIMYLQRHPDGFKGGWKELIDVGECEKRGIPFNKVGQKWEGTFWGKDKVYAKKMDCFNVQGHATILMDTLKKLKARSFLVDRFEQVLHIEYGGVEFYKARRSLVFAQHLRDRADEFREKKLNSNDIQDKTIYAEDWREQVPEDESALGGPYLAMHMRRGDFSYAHKETVPSIEEVGKEIAKQLKEYKLKKVYLSTDGTDEEVKELQTHFKAKIYRFPRGKKEVEMYKDGGIAIIDQWIASHARFFIGTCSSTFSFRIYEERDILGFSPKTTFNCICGEQAPKDRCEQPGSWRVKFG